MAMAQTLGSGGVLVGPVLVFSRTPMMQGCESYDLLSHSHSQILHVWHKIWINIHESTHEPGFRGDAIYLSLGWFQRSM